MAPFLVLTGECQCTFGKGVCLLYATSQHMHLSHGEMTARLLACPGRSFRLLQRLCEQRHGVGDAPAEGISHT